MNQYVNKPLRKKICLNWVLNIFHCENTVTIVYGKQCCLNFNASNNDHIAQTCVCVCLYIHIYIYIVRYTLYIKHSMQRYATGEVTMSLLGEEDLGEW